MARLENEFDDEKYKSRNYSVRNFEDVYTAQLGINNSMEQSPSWETKTS